jgi:hypothetical protein
MKNNIEFKPITYSEDELEQIVNLLKAGLNLDFSLEFFKWKHLENPFGKSFGLIATYEGRIIGLRMFMFWQFINKKQEKKTAIRPVDTVVDKKFRGRGLFKKLTLDGIEMCQGKFDLIFNTPNQNSLPGYLKMGWNSLDNSPDIKMGLLNPFSKRTDIQEFDVNSFGLDKDYMSSSLIWQTNKTGEFLQWRYEDNKYLVVQCADSFMIFSITKMKGFKTIIIFELLGDSEKFQGMINAAANKENAFFIYFADNKEFEAVKCIASITRKSSSVVFKNASENIQKNINFSLGDLEGKL